MAINWRDCEHMYLNDPVFSHLVKFLESFLETCEMAPSDLRAAVMFAVTRHEMRRPPRVFITNEEWIKLTQKNSDLLAENPDLLPNPFKNED